MGYSWSQQDESVGAGFVRIATEQLAKAALNADAVGDPPAGRIHAARRNCKRLRGLFRLVRSDFGDYDRANAAVRDAADRLSAVRDAAVMRDTLEKLYDWAGHPPPPKFEEQPTDIAAENAALLTFRDDVADLMGATKAWKTGKIDIETLSKGFGRCYRDGAKAAGAAHKKPSDEAFHDWRKQVKYHSFHLLLLKRCLADPNGADLERVEHLAELLGRHHDLAVLRMTAKSDPNKLAVEIDPAFIEHNASLMQDRLAARAFGLGAEIFARPAKVVRQSIEARWHDWWQKAAEVEPA